MTSTTNFVCNSNMNKHLFNATINHTGNVIWVSYIYFLCQVSDIATNRNCIKQRERLWVRLQNNQYLILCPQFILFHYFPPEDSLVFFKIVESIILFIVSDDFKYSSFKWKWEEETEPLSPNSLLTQNVNWNYVSMKNFYHHINHSIPTCTLDGNISNIFIIRTEILSDRTFLIIML